MAVTLKPKVSVKAGTEDQVQQETVAQANTAEREKERVVIKEYEVNEQTKAPKLVNVFEMDGGTYQERLEQPRSIHLVMTLDRRPTVVFEGFWDGRLIQSAMNAIARQYRQRRIIVSKM
jgi:hypothetical protein